MKKKKKSFNFNVLFFLLGVLAAIYLIQKTPSLVVNAASTCQAKDPATMKNCLAQVQNGSVSTVNITAVIKCQNATTCGFLVDGVRRPVTIQGTSSSYGIKRSKAFNYSFRIVNSDGITLKNLTFADETNSCNPLDEQLCAPMVLFHNSTNIMVDRIKATDARRTAIAINATGIAPIFTVTNSTFTNSAAHAITTYVTVAGGMGRIANNTFTKNVSNAVAFNVPATAANPSIIEGNTFVHNHRGAIYKTCGDTANQPCPGGQLYFPSGARHVLVRNNTFKDGYADVPTANSDVGVAGIEIMHNDNHYIAISNNMFNHNSTGIMINYDTAMDNLSSNITIVGNTFTNNIKHDTYFFNYPTYIDVSNNTYK